MRLPRDERAGLINETVRIRKLKTGLKNPPVGVVTGISRVVVLVHLKHEGANGAEGGAGDR